MRSLIPFVFGAVALGACAAVPGDPDTIVVDGEPIAGYAWSGPASYHHYIGGGTEDVDLVAWQIWFTNTDECPSRTNDYTAGLLIVSTERVTPPSMQLPTLASMTVPIVPFFGTTLEINEPVVNLGVEDIDYANGTLTLSRFDTEEVTGHFEATGKSYSTDQDLEIHGTFVAHRCSRLHD